MALVIKDRVKELTTTGSTGAVTLAGAVTGYQAFSTIGNGNTTYYTIQDTAAGTWEVGIGTYSSSGNTLSRDTVLASSNSGNLVNFSSNAKDVFITQPSASVGGSVSTITSSGTWTKPAISVATDIIQVELWGAGGGGGGGGGGFPSYTGGDGGAGGGGSYRSFYGLASTFPSSTSVVIGSGGTAGTAGVVGTSGSNTAVFTTTSNLVNGTFTNNFTTSPLISSTNLITNGTFDSSSNWTLGTGWTISGGTLNGSSIGSTSNATQASVTNNGVRYQAIYTITSYTSGNVVVSVGGTGGTNRNTAATFTELLVAGSAGSYSFGRGNSNFTGSIDNAIMYRQEDWYVTAAWAYDGTNLRATATDALNTSYLRQSFATSIAAGTPVQLVYTQNRTSGSATLTAGVGGVIDTIASTGASTRTINATVASTANYLEFTSTATSAGTGWNGYIDDVTLTSLPSVTLGSGWAYNFSTDVATATTSSSTMTITPTVAAVAGNLYEVIYTVTRTAGTITPTFGGTALTARTTSGTYTENITATTTGSLIFTGTSFSGTITLSSISVKLITIGTTGGTGGNGGSTSFTGVVAAGGAGGTGGTGATNTANGTAGTTQAIGVSVGGDGGSGVLSSNGTAGTAGAAGLARITVFHTS